MGRAFNPSLESLRHPKVSDLAIFTKDCGANPSETSENVSENSADHSAIYVIPAYDFGLGISLKVLRNASNSNLA